MNLDLNKLFEGQQKALPRLRAESARERVKRIRKIRAYLMDTNNETALCKAMWTDLRKSRTEVIYTEVGPLLMAIRHIIGRLDRWMRDKPVQSPLSMAGLRSHIQYEPKGNCLVISPWNYPFQLSLMATLYAISAGNAVIIKPSELSPATSAYLERMIRELFDPSEVAVVTGEVEVATELLSLPFNHIFFTGSPQVGKIIMAAAAQHLASVTLELGGKSPVIIDGTRSVSTTGTQLAWSKSINAGQTCIAPDYVLIPKGKIPELVWAFKNGIEKFYDPDEKGIVESPDLGRIINERHYKRIKGLYDDAIEKGAKLEYGGEFIEAERFISPTILSNCNESMEIMQEEIFGPVLPLVAFDRLEEVPEILASRPKPLAFYIQSKSRKNIRYILDNSSSGGTVINEFMLTSLNPHLPFGGINHSGIGKSNGFHGFVEFSNERGIIKRTWGTFSFLYPPFKPWLSKWLKRLFNQF